MTRRWASRLFVLLATAACGREGEMSLEQGALRDTTSAEVRSVDDLPPTPELPTARRGHLAAVSAGTFQLSGAWRAEATACNSPALLELFGGVRGMRTLLVIRDLAERADWAGEYAVMLPDSASEEARSAQLAVQVFHEPEATGFQAIEGEVHLAPEDGFVTGWFDSVLWETRSHMLVRYIGAFDRVRVTAGDRGHCDQLAGVVDSTAVDTEAVADTLH